MDPWKRQAPSCLFCEWKVKQQWGGTHLGGQGAASGPSCRRICYTRWSRAARTRPPAPTLKRWSAPPYSRQTVASPPGMQAAEHAGSQRECSGALGLLKGRLDSGDGARKQEGNAAGLTKRHHTREEKKNKVRRWNSKSNRNHENDFCLPAVTADEH